MGEPARFRLKVRHYEVDDYGHVNHAHYVHYLETARVEALDALGLGLREMRRHGLMIVAAELTVKYHSPAGPSDVLEIVTHIRELRGARTLWVQEVRDAISGRLVASAEVTGAFMTDTGRPARAPALFHERLASLHIPDDSSPPAATMSPPRQ
ncbi:MAG TPA: thioesterase family protein [Methylomirabilota bacterium]